MGSPAWVDVLVCAGKNAKLQRNQTKRNKVYAEKYSAYWGNVFWVWVGSWFCELSTSAINGSAPLKNKRFRKKLLVGSKRFMPLSLWSHWGPAAPPLPAPRCPRQSSASESPKCPCVQIRRAVRLRKSLRRVR
jgi:hypothetical protein